MNSLEAGRRVWLQTPAGRVYAAEHGGERAALAAMADQDAAEVRAAAVLQDEVERVRGRRPDRAEALAAVHRDPVGQLSGSTADVVAALNQHDPSWHIRVDEAPRDARVVNLGRA